MSKYRKDLRDSSYSRSQSETVQTSTQQVNYQPTGQVAPGGATNPNSATGSPMTGSKIVKTVKQMGDKTRTKTRDILKRWQTMNNGQMSEDSMIGPDDISDLSGSTDSAYMYPAKKKGTWSVHVWSKYYFFYCIIYKVSI